MSHQKNVREEADESGKESRWKVDIRENANEMLEKGRAVFRFETFGDESFWTDKLQLHKAIADKGAGGIGEGLSPKAALAAGLKVDIWDMSYATFFHRTGGWNTISLKKLEVMIFRKIAHLIKLTLRKD